MNPTNGTYTELQDAYSHFNEQLFNSELPWCLITLQREKSSLGYFCKGNIANASGQETDEIALNPAHFARRGVKMVLSTLVHEMAHLWQVHYGNPGRGRYHNAEWANKMEAIGLMPSNTGEPGGKRTGDRMTHYIIEDGLFAKAFAALEKRTEFKLWGDKQSKFMLAIGGLGGEGGDTDELTVAVEPPTNKKGGRSKYICACKEPCQVWAKPGLTSLHCTDCEQDFAEEP